MSSGEGQSAFEKLLGALDSDRERAGELYERLRDKLVTFFDWRSALSPEDLADKTIDRVGRKLEAGEVIASADVMRYAYGVAKNILREHWNEKKREAVSLRRFPQEPTAERRTGLRVADGLGERRLGCLKKCLGALSQPSRELILRYYEGEGGLKIARRKVLAETLGMPVGVLRTRAFRLRARLESCVEKCLGKDGKGEMISQSDHKGRVVVS